jgi:hypothetical protein
MKVMMTKVMAKDELVGDRAWSQVRIRTTELRSSPA